MAKRERILKEYKVLNNSQFNLLRVSLSYNIGGMNYWTGTSQQRGLDLHVTPLFKSENSIRYIGFSGTKMFVLPMGRFNQKTLDTFEVPQEKLDLVFNKVVKEHDLKLEEWK